MVRLSAARGERLGIAVCELEAEERVKAGKAVSRGAAAVLLSTVEVETWLAALTGLWVVAWAMAARVVDTRAEVTLGEIGTVMAAWAVSCREVAARSERMATLHSSSTATLSTAFVRPTLTAANGS